MINIQANSSVEYFRYCVYKMYKLDWLIQHNYTLTDVIKLLQEIIIDDEDLLEDTPESIEGYIEEYGFNSEIWVCYDEFLDYEYQDTEYIKTLLKGNTDYLKLYENDIKENFK